MTSDTQMYEDRRHIFKHYFSNKLTVTELCKRFNRSRTWYYKWNERYQAYGDKGLMNVTRSAPAMPNRTSLDVEMKILDVGVNNPNRGPVFIVDELSDKGINVKQSAVYNVLKRHNLNTRKKRLEYLQIRNGVVANAKRFP